MPEDKSKHCWNSNDKILSLIWSQTLTHALSSEKKIQIFCLCLKPHHRWIRFSCSYEIIFFLLFSLVERSFRVFPRKWNMNRRSLDHKCNVFVINEDSQKRHTTHKFAFETTKPSHRQISANSVSPTRVLKPSREQLRMVMCLYRIFSFSLTFEMELTGKPKEIW